MREIGGYIELEYNYGTEYYEYCIALNTARNCLSYLIKKRNIKKLLLPYYLCDTVREKCEEMGCVNLEFYKLNNHLLPIYDKKMNENEYIYIVNYYGLLNNEIIQQLKERYHNIIIDNVQAFFAKPVKNVDTIYSCRKFFGVPDGAYLYTNLQLDNNIIRDKSNGRMQHLLGRFENLASEYYDLYKEINIKLKKEPLKQMSKLTHNLLKGLDYERIKQIRTSNFDILNSKLKKYNKIQVKEIVGAYCYPFYTDDAKTLREKLIENKVYVPILWPNLIENQAKEFANNILPLPVDQRYNIDDMTYICDLIIQ